MDGPSVLGAGRAGGGGGSWWLGRKKSAPSTATGSLSARSSLRRILRGRRGFPVPAGVFLSSGSKSNSMGSAPSLRRRRNGQHRAGGQAGGGLVLQRQPAVPLADVVGAGRVDEAGRPVLHFHVDGQIAGVHIVHRVGVQRQVQDGAVIAVDQLGFEGGVRVPAGSP